MAKKRKRKSNRLFGSGTAMNAAEAVVGVGIGLAALSALKSH
jgi:hypothetical protein